MSFMGAIEAFQSGLFLCLAPLVDHKEAPEYCLFLCFAHIMSSIDAIEPFRSYLYRYIAHIMSSMIAI